MKKATPPNSSAQGVLADNGSYAGMTESEIECLIKGDLAELRCVDIKHGGTKLRYLREATNQFGLMPTRNISGLIGGDGQMAIFAVLHDAGMKSRQSRTATSEGPKPAQAARKRVLAAGRAQG